MELAHLQAWVKKSGARVVIVLHGGRRQGRYDQADHREGEPAGLPRDRAARADRTREIADLHARYINHLPAAGEVVIFDRSWYNQCWRRPSHGVQQREEGAAVLEPAPRFEAAIAESGVTLLKYFPTVSEEGAGASLPAPHRRSGQAVKLSPMDVESYQRWWDYTCAYDEMLR